MRQQINLYQPIFSETRKPLSSRMVALGVGLVIGGLAAYSVHANINLQKLNAEVAALRVEQAEQDALATQSGEDLATKEKPALVEARIKSLNRQISDRRSALKVLQAGAAGQTSGFAARMEALARRHVDGLWLDKMVLSGTTGAMSLSGASLDADTVPAYLKSLASEPVLSGTRFDDFIIERPVREKIVEAPTLDDGGAETIKAKKSALPLHVRFRAGSKSLDVAAPEAST